MATLNQMVREFERLLSVKPKYVVARESISGGDFLVIEGNALGPIVASYPGTQEGHIAAMRDVARLNQRAA